MNIIFWYIQIYENFKYKGRMHIHVTKILYKYIRLMEKKNIYIYIYKINGTYFWNN